MLEGTRVLDLSEGIAGGYCTKLLVDAGAAVVKAEPPTGDALRGWSASGAELDGADGALFEFLAAGKRSVVGDLRSAPVAPLLAGADLVVEHGVLSDEDLRWLEDAHPGLSVLSITPFGRSGPWRDRPATEFVLQALCGSIAGRGTLERPPVHAGGRLGEWIAGTFGAVAAVAALRGARRGGAGERVDLSVLECMTIVMAGSAPLMASLAGGDPDQPPTVPPRTVELPSIEPSADGYVGFCTVTGQQFRDFLVLIGRPDLLDDADLARFGGRYARRHEFLPIVWEWTTARTTAEIEEQASLLRIPVAPIGTPETITTFAQFVERGVYRRLPGGALAPRPPYAVDGEVPRATGRAPRLGQDTGVAGWEPRRAGGAECGSAAGRSATVRGGAPGDAADPAAGDGTGPGHRGHHPRPALPLGGIRVVDLTAFWAGPAATLVLASLGAEVVKVESARRPDPMRFTSVKSPEEPQWWEWGSVFLGNNANKRGVTLDLTSPEGRDLLLQLVAGADAVIENFSPRVLDNFGLSGEVLSSANPRAVVVRMPAFGLDGPWRDRTGFAQTMEQISGMAWMTGYADGPPIIPRGPCDPLAGMHAAFCLLAALEERERSGRGHVVECAMVEAALNAAVEVVLERSAYDTSLCRDGNRGPVSAPQGVYACRSDDGREHWLALAVPDASAWTGLVRVLGSPPWALDPSLAGAPGRRAAHDLLDAELSRWCAGREVGAVVADLLAAGVPAARVTEPAAVLGHPQLRARGFVEAFEHPVVGRHETMGMPFRFASVPGPWLRTPPPTVGEHNDEVLGAELGLGPEQLAELAAAGVIGDSPIAR